MNKLRSNKTLKEIRWLLPGGCTKCVLKERETTDAGQRKITYENDMKGQNER